ncbi:MAG TPA: hypothetical protein VMV77_02965 [Bacteroidales bacterium]|nr:hypothetical protein [Bacteroidales bacterium]
MKIDQQIVETKKKALRTEIRLHRRYIDQIKNTIPQWVLEDEIKTLKKLKKTMRKWFKAEHSINKKQLEETSTRMESARSDRQIILDLFTQEVWFILGIGRSVVVMDINRLYKSMKRLKRRSTGINQSNYSFSEVA